MNETLLENPQDFNILKNTTANSFFLLIAQSLVSCCLLHRLFQGQASADFDARGGITCECGARAGGLEASAERERERSRATGDEAVSVAHESRYCILVSHVLAYNCDLRRYLQCEMINYNN